MSARAQAVFPDFEHVADIVYKKVGDTALELDLLVPKTNRQTPAPLLVYIHGGGWGGGDRSKVSKKTLADIVNRCGTKGIVCATIEYRLTDGTSTAFDSVVDCKDALRFLVKHAKEYGIDPTRIGLFGSSAGGHLSLVTALGAGKDFPGDPALAGCDPASLRCETAFYPATDFTDEALAGRFRTDTRATKMFGGPAAEKEDLIRLLSPVYLIAKDSTPVYLLHGDSDKTLDVEHSRRLFKKGQAVGADIRYTEAKNGGHGLAKNCEPTPEEISRMAADYMIERLTR